MLDFRPRFAAFDTPRVSSTRSRLSALLGRSGAILLAIASPGLLGLLIVRFAGPGFWRSEVPDTSYTSYASETPDVKPAPAVVRSTSSPEVNRIAETIRRNEGLPIEDFWKVRMAALVDLARLGAAAAPAVAELMEDGNASVRALAAESLGILGDLSTSAILERAVVSDPDSQVRLYAARSLGQLGTIRPTAAILQARDGDNVIDVRTHLEMALSGRNSSEGGEIRDALASFDLGQIDSAVVDRPAPDFRLRDLDGTMYSLSEFRGKCPVVLVFLVGDICPYCPGQISRLRQHKQQFEELGAKLLLVEAHETFRLAKTARRSSSKAGIGFPILSDASQTVSAKYGVAMHARAHTEWSNRPASFVIDRSGVLRLAHLDQADHRIDPEDLLQVVRLVNHLDSANAELAAPEFGAIGF